MTTVLVSGPIANKHRNGGATWTRLSWLLAFRQLGFHVYFIEHIRRSNCVDADGASAPFEESANLAYFWRVVDQFGLTGSAALIYEGGEAVAGMTWSEVVDLAESADLLVNISGHLDLEALLARVRRKVYVDLDPGYTQFWHAAGLAGARLAEHDFYFTVGENIGKPSCAIPTSGIDWRPVRQPVVLEQWPVSRLGSPDHFTTVASWRGPYGPIQQGDIRFGPKAHEFRKFVDLPQRAPGTFEILLEIHPADDHDLRSLRCHGWQIVDPKSVVPDPFAFRQYVQSSGAEFSVAQGMYIQTQSGWFSDRSVRYLASGKPTLVQDTGFSQNLPTGEGLLTFCTQDEAVARVKEVLSDYERHCRAARDLACGYFAPEKALGGLLEVIGLAP